MYFEEIYLLDNINGGWSYWGNYTTCSVSCGGGAKIRRRTCTNPIPVNGGKLCPGPTEEIVNCNTNRCPGLSSKSNL